MRVYLTEYTHLFIQADKHRTARQLHKQSTLYTHTHAATQTPVPKLYRRQRDGEYSHLEGK